jgi:hypothetical protein
MGKKKEAFVLITQVLLLKGVYQDKIKIAMRCEGQKIIGGLG